uniref:Uncharacterized protein n=1 Tax=Arundo donax TaxID=35708 RepID=A0A0A9ENB5_ARUDO
MLLLQLSLKNDFLIVLCSIAGVHRQWC